MNPQSTEKKEFFKSGESAVIIIPGLSSSDPETRIACRVETIIKKKKRGDKHAKVEGIVCLYLDGDKKLQKQTVHPKLLTRPSAAA